MNYMGRDNSDKSNLVNMTIRVEPEYLSDLQLYSRVIGKNRSEIVRELVISALDAIPENERRAMEIIAKCKTPSWLATTQMLYDNPPYNVRVLSYDVRLINHN